MIRNYFKIAWRNLWKHRFYSGINILGLFSGLTFTLLLSAYIWGETQVNQQLKNADRQVILLSDWKEDNMGLEFTSLGPLSKILKEEYPSLVENYFRWDGITSNISKGDQQFREGILLGDSTLISMFGFKLLHGNKSNLLKNPYSLLLTEENALKYFGKTDVVGKHLSIENFSGSRHDFLIEGVLENLPKNSISNLNRNDENGIFISYSVREFFNRGDFEDWNNIYVPSYVELKKGVSIEELEAPIQKLIDQHASDQIQSNLNVKPTYLTDYYLQKDNGIVTRMVYTLSVISLFILIMAIINFINISISAAGRRMKEIGVRKVLGSIRLQIIGQFLIESLIIVVIASLLALISFVILNPFFSELVGTKIPSISSFPSYFLALIVLFILLISFMAGVYPAFVLSSLKPKDAIKGQLQTKVANIFMRKSLVGFQFAIALIVLISSLIITNQVDFFFGKNLGYNNDYVLSAQVPRDWSANGVQKMETIRNEFESIAEIKSASLSYEIPNGNNGLFLSIYKIGSAESEAIKMTTLTVDEHFTSTYEIPLKSGTSFQLNGDLDPTGVLLNEEAIKVFNFNSAEEALGQQIRIRDSDTNYTIHGVIKNFHFNSMHRQIEPMILFHVEANEIYRYLNFRLHPSNINGSLEKIQIKWSNLLNGSPFEYQFMDDNLIQIYESELQLKNAVFYAAILALIIVLLGVIGLVSLSVHNRIKEIGIRKVIGASSIIIIILFLHEFLTTIVIGSVIAFPICYYIMQDWLNNYVYSVQITALPFMYSFFGLASIIFILIGILTFKAANLNPIHNLRNE